MAGVKGRGSAAMVAIVVAVGLLAIAPGAFAATYEVGGATQEWDFASNGYSYDTNWSPLQTFHPNDVLGKARFFWLNHQAFGCVAYLPDCAKNQML